MNICIDMRPALSRPTGVGVYLKNMVRNLAQLDERNRYLLFSSSWKERFPRTVQGKNFEVFDLRLPVRFLNFAWNRFSIPRIESLVKRHVDIVHSPTPLVIPAKHARKITTVMDLYFYFHPDETQSEIKRDYAELIQKHCMISDAVIAISEHTKQQLVEHLKVPASRVYTIHLGVDRFYSERVSEEDLNHVLVKYGIRQPYFLFVGAPEPRKNLRLLYQAFEGLNEDVMMVLTGPEGEDHGATNGISQKIIRTGYVPSEHLRALYQGAVALTFPSFEEGFGLPLLEAMASGIPVVASRIPVFQEICGDAFLSFENDSSEELREAMRKIANDSTLRNQLIAQGTERIEKFSWRDTAAKTLEIYNHL